jgi:hypothetical protein
MRGSAMVCHFDQFPRFQELEVCDSRSTILLFCDTVILYTISALLSSCENFPIFLAESVRRNAFVDKMEKRAAARKRHF